MSPSASRRTWTGRAPRSGTRPSQPRSGPTPAVAGPVTRPPPGSGSKDTLCRRKAFTPPVVFAKCGSGGSNVIGSEKQPWGRIVGVAGDPGLCRSFSLELMTAEKRAGGNPCPQAAPARCQVPRYEVCLRPSQGEPCVTQPRAPVRHRSRVSFFGAMQRVTASTNLKMYL